MKFLVMVNTMFDVYRYAMGTSFLTDDKNFAAKFDSYTEAEEFAKSVNYKNYKIVEG